MVNHQFFFIIIFLSIGLIIVVVLLLYGTVLENDNDELGQFDDNPDNRII